MSVEDTGLGLSLPLSGEFGRQLRGFLKVNPGMVLTDQEVPRRASQIIYASFDDGDRVKMISEVMSAPESRNLARPLWELSHSFRPMRMFVQLSLRADHFCRLADSLDGKDKQGDHLVCFLRLMEGACALDKGTPVTMSAEKNE
jgi:hypothetical protein